MPGLCCFPWRGRAWRGLGLTLAGLTWAGAAAAQDISDLPLEDLLQREVTSVAKRPQQIADAPAAVFLITQEDIRRSGAQSIDELLRMVPGMEVAKVSPDGAAVSARGFNSRFSNKLLVLVDGRGVYVSTLPGVLWDQQITPLEDIQRIEVVRGPGATLWGANAVNGVINIVTKHAVDSLGAGITAWGDDDGGSRASGRIGFRVGEDGALRLSGTEVRRRGRALYQGQAIDDSATVRQASFRYDVEPSDHDAFTVQGDLQDGTSGDGTPTSNSDFRNHNLLARWSRRDDGDTGWSLQTYWEHGRRASYGLIGAKDQLDLDFTRYAKLGDRHSLVFGAGYRWSKDHIEGGLLRFVPDRLEEVWYGAYLQDDVTVTPRLTVSLGAKVEHNVFTGVEWQPSVRAIWKAPAGWSVWAAVSRAVRTSSRLETAMVFEQPFQRMVESPDLAAEVLVAYEAGWRGQLSERLSVDVTAYHQVYDKLIGNFATPTFTLAFTGAQLRFENRGTARTTGVEAAVDARLSPVWTVKAAASTSRMTADYPSINVGVGSNYDPTSMPRGQLSLRSMYDLSDAVDVDVWLRRVGSIGGLGDGTLPVKAYSDLDIRLAWRVTPRLELFLRGENLLRASRMEFRELTDSPIALVDRRIAFGFGLRR